MLLRGGSAFLFSRGTAGSPRRKGKLSRPKLSGCGARDDSALRFEGCGCALLIAQYLFTRHFREHANILSQNRLHFIEIIRSHEKEYAFRATPILQQILIVQKYVRSVWIFRSPEQRSAASINEQHLA